MRCKATIERKSMLYKTKVEYGDYTMNHVVGCSHGCLYPCYAYLMAKRFGRVRNYDEWIEPVLVSNTLDLLKQEIPRLKSKIKTVQLCFTTDPFMYGYEDICAMSLEAIKLLNRAGISCTALTKGVLPMELAEQSKENAYGITLISLNESYREKNEPGAAPYSERIKSLKRLHDSGFQTWVSMEPYPTPNILSQNLLEILEAVSFTDKIIFGRTNYNKQVSSFPAVKEWYTEQAHQVISFCNSRGIAYHIKKGTIA